LPKNTWHTHTHINTPYTHRHTQTRYAHAHTHTHVRIHTRTRTYTYTHIHTLAHSLCRLTLLLPAMPCGQIARSALAVAKLARIDRQKLHGPAGSIMPVIDDSTLHCFLSVLETSFEVQSATADKGNERLCAVSRADIEGSLRVADS